MSQYVVLKKKRQEQKEGKNPMKSKYIQIKYFSLNWMRPVKVISIAVTKLLEIKTDFTQKQSFSMSVPACSRKLTEAEKG